MRPMLTEDLGDPKVFEDEAIREQAARLQVHAENLYSRMLKNKVMSGETEYRIGKLMNVVEQLSDEAAYALKYRPL